MRKRNRKTADGYVERFEEAVRAHQDLGADLSERHVNDRTQIERELFTTKFDLTSYIYKLLDAAKEEK